MTDDTAMRRRAVLLGATGLAGAAGLAAATVIPSTFGNSTAHAQVPQPTIDDTATWGARPPGRGPDYVSPPSMLIVHHSVSANTDDFSRDQAWAHARWVQDLHIDGNGWYDTGYNFVVSRGGHITEGRHESLDALLDGTYMIQGAHTSGQNTVGLGICNEGAYHDGAVPPDAQWSALVDICAFACQQYGIDPYEIYGHKDFGSTLCPGIIHDMLPELRDAVAAQLD